MTRDLELETLCMCVKVLCVCGVHASVQLTHRTFLTPCASGFSMFTLAMIKGDCMLHTTQTKNMMRTVWYQHSSSLLFVL